MGTSQVIQSPIFLYNRLPYQEPVLVTLAASKTREHFIISRGDEGHRVGGAQWNISELDMLKSDMKKQNYNDRVHK